MFSRDRLILARKRRRISAKSLSEKAGVSPVSISRIERGVVDTPDEATVKKIAKALDYPVAFFYQEEMDAIEPEAVSFRSLTKMTAKERDAALSAGSLGLTLMEWIEERFQLPKPNLLDLSYESNTEVVAQVLRQHWGIGVQPISSVIHLLETQGVRFLSLSENTASVDAFSFWRNDVPFIFLNNFKTAERSIFDAAHELGHLVMHVHSDVSGRPVEQEANAFASAFLMPKEDVVARAPRFITADVVIGMKKRWRVSAMAMAYRLQSLGLLSDWQYKSICIELTRRGYRSNEPIGIDRETSAIWRKVLAQLWTEKVTKSNIAQQLSWPLDEVEGLVSGLVQERFEKEEFSKVKLQIV